MQIEEEDRHGEPKEDPEEEHDEEDDDP